jgi:hypothetical protein
VQVYLASPTSRLQAHMLDDMPVLLSFATRHRWLTDWVPSFSHLLIDSGAFSELGSGLKVDLSKYMDWAEQWCSAEAIASLDDIGGDWKRSLKNLERQPGSFPTFHDTDPPELLDELVACAVERKTWIGLGLLPPRQGKEQWIRRACDRIPVSIHVHGWAMRAYTHIRRLDSVDSTNWFRDALDIQAAFPWIMGGEALELVVKRYKRWNRVVRDPTTQIEFDMSL